jgi:hypothetical protein
MKSRTVLKPDTKSAVKKKRKKELKRVKKVAKKMIKAKKKIVKKVKKAGY